MSVITVEEYAKLLEKIVRDLDDNSDDSRSGVVSDNESDESLFGDDSQYMALKKLADKKNQYNELKKKIALKEDDHLMKDVNYVIGIGLNTLASLQTKLAYLNQNLKNIDRHVLTLHAKQTLSIEKCAQKEFFEIIRMIVKFCNSFDEELKVLRDENSIDWESVIKKMKEEVARDRVALAQMDRLFDELKSLYSSVSHVCNQTENEV